MNGFGSEALCGGNNVNRSVARAYTSDSAANMDFAKRAELCLLDELHGTARADEIFSRQRESVGFSKPDANEDGVEILFELWEGNIASDRGLLPEFDAEVANHLDFAQ